jgi:hypothetical protein
MPADENPEWSLVDFARQIAEMPSAPEAAFNFTEPVPNGKKMDLPPASAKPTDMSAEDPPVSREQGPASAECQDTQPAPIVAPGTSRKRQLRTPDEIATMILTMLRAVDSCPDRGLVVTVYGSNPWNAMLAIRPEAGPAIDGPRWFSRVREIGVRLRDEFDVIQATKSLISGVPDDVTGLAGAPPSDEGEDN